MSAFGTIRTSGFPRGPTGASLPLGPALGARCPEGARRRRLRPVDCVENRRASVHTKSVRTCPVDFGAKTSLYSTASAACTSGFAEIKDRVSTWQSATASFSGDVCTLSVGGVSVGTLAVLTKGRLDPVPSSTIVALEAVRDDGQVVRFLVQGSAIVAPPSVRLRLGAVSGGYALEDEADNVESYDSSGRLLSVSTRGGIVHTMGYDAAQRLSTVTDSFGHALTLGYDILSRLKSMTDPGGRIVQYGYDAQGRLVMANHGDGTTRGYLYENAAFPEALTGLTDESAVRSSTWGYDTQGRATSTQEAGGANAVTLVYNTNGTVTATDALGAVRTFGFGRYGDRNLVTGISGSQCPACSELAATAYDLAGFLGSRTDYNGNITNYTHDSRGLETSRTEAYGTLVARTITTQWHATHRQPTLITEPNRTIAFTHDAHGNVLTRTVTDTSVTPNVERTWTFTYNGHGQVLTEDGPRSDVSDVTSHAYYSCTTGYQCGRLYTVTNALNQTTTFHTYNAHGQPLTLTDPNGVVTTLAYDTRQRLTSRQIGSETTTFQYWPTGLLKKVTLPDSSYLLYGYDDAHRLIKIEDHEGNRVEYALDAMGNRTTESAYDPSNALAHTRTQVFNSSSQLWKQIGAAGTSAVTTVYYDAGPNGAGRLTGTTDASGSTSWTYTAQGRIASRTQTMGSVVKSVAYGYDADGRLASISYPSGSIVTLGYSAGAVTSLTLNGSMPILSGVLYEPFGPVAGWSWGNGTLAVRSRDLDGQPTQIDSAGLKTFAYDEAFRITSIADADDATRSWSYGYDVLDRLTSAARTGLTQSWTYDANGNRLSEGGTAPSIYTVASTSNRLTAVTGALTRSFSFDAAGNVTADGTRSLSYDDAGRLVSVTVGGQTSVFTYNALGQRVKKASAAGTRHFVYDEAGHPLGEYDGAGNLIEELVWLGDTPVASIRPNGGGVGIFYLHTDHLNTPRRLTRVSDNAIVWRWDGDAFGNGAPDEDPDGNGLVVAFHHRFPGQYFDTETGLHYNYFRDYDPQIGRYVESDPIGLEGGVNTYAYVGANPISVADPLGLYVKKCSRVLGNTRGKRAASWNPLRHDYLNVSGTFVGLYPGNGDVWGQGRVIKDPNYEDDDGKCTDVCRDPDFDQYVLDAAAKNQPTYCPIAAGWGGLLGGIAYAAGARNCQTWASEVLETAKREYLRNQKCPKCFQ